MTGLLRHPAALHDDVTNCDGQRIRMEELAQQSWRQGRIKRERFFHDPTRLVEASKVKEVAEPKEEPVFEARMPEMVGKAATYRNFVPLQRSSFPNGRCVQ